MRQGYYIPTQGAFGDLSLAREAAAIWDSFGHASPSRVDGVSIIIREGDRSNIETARVVMRDFFRNAVKCYPPAAPFEVPHIHVFDVPRMANPRSKP